jgi:hypothetical protein
MRYCFYYSTRRSLRRKYSDYLTSQQNICAFVYACVYCGHLAVQNVYPKKGAFNMLYYDRDRRLDALTICAL